MNLKEACYNNSNEFKGLKPFHSAAAKQREQIADYKMLNDLVYTIDKMTLEDAEAVAAIERASFKDPWPVQYFITELISNRLASYLVARYNEQVIAYIGAWIIFDEIHITTLAVAEDRRNHGIATCLLAQLIHDLKLHSAECITLEVRPSNSAARSFYEKQGFKACGNRRKYYKDEDAIIMTKQLL
jgi:[ribosomal protein S18]-alanine N-acetyltransferase